MRYMGSKSRIAKHIVPLMEAQRGERPWIEPFVGGGNIIERVKGERIGYDLNHNAIEALKVIRDRPYDLPIDSWCFTESDYNNRAKEFPWLRGFAAFAYSFGSKEWGGWARDRKGGRDFVAEGRATAIKQSPKIQGVQFICSNYTNIRLEKPSLIYCDPPYALTTSYKNSKGFSHTQFWQWCYSMVDEGHLVFVSEYTAPEGMGVKSIWQKEIYSNLNVTNQNKKKGIENLFQVH